MRSLLICAAKSAQLFLAALVRTISNQPAVASARTRQVWVPDALEAKHPAPVGHPDGLRRADRLSCLPVQDLDPDLWHNPQER
jgi:hypothetical protein